MADEKRDPKALLEDAIRRRNELNTFIKVLQEMIGGGGAPEATAEGAGAKEAGSPSTDVADPMSVVFPGMFFGKSQPQAVKMLLERVRRPLKTRAIIEALDKGGMKVGGKNPNVNLWSILKRADEIFIIVPKAGWGLIDWYDAKVIEKMRKEGGKENGEGNDDKEDNK
jgi:hypothetical protein